MTIQPGVGAWVIPPAYTAAMKLPLDPYQRQRVLWATVGLQEALIRRKFLTRPVKPLDGVFGPKTREATIAFQTKNHLVPDGQIGPKTAVRLFNPDFVWWETALSIPDNLLMGLLRLESGLDPGAEGRVDEADRGIAQFNRRAHPDISDHLAYSNPAWCIQRAADDLVSAYFALGVESWDPAVANHNNPAKARAWAKWILGTGGYAPDDQISEYVRLVRVVSHGTV